MGARLIVEYVQYVCARARFSMHLDPPKTSTQIRTYRSQVKKELAVSMHKFKEASLLSQQLKQLEANEAQIREELAQMEATLIP